MRAKDAATYNPEFPEMFTWGHLDSPKLSSIAFDIANEIAHDIRACTSQDRLYTPGLRRALNLIAEHAEI